VSDTERVHVDSECNWCGRWPPVVVSSSAIVPKPLGGGVVVRKCRKTIELPGSLADAVSALAATHGRSWSAEVRESLRAWIVAAAVTIAEPEADPWSPADLMSRDEARALGFSFVHEGTSQWGSESRPSFKAEIRTNGQMVSFEAETPGQLLQQCSDFVQHRARMGFVEKATVVVTEGDAPQAERAPKEVPA
jgi:hypothetical protein